MFGSARDAAHLLGIAALLNGGDMVSDVHGFRKASEEAWARLIQAEDSALPSEFPGNPFWSLRDDRTLIRRSDSRHQAGTADP